MLVQTVTIILSFIASSFLIVAMHLSRSEMGTKESLRLVIISDTHRSFRHRIPDGDVLIHAGDSELTANEMDSWVASLPHTHKLAVCGNMDFRLETENHKLENVSYLQDSHTLISGIKFYGSPWTPEFVGVFQLASKTEAKEVWQKIPPDVDVLITHGPPKGILDRTSRGLVVGDEQLLQTVEERKPRVHCFGHVHESYGTLRTKDTIFCNAAVYNGNPAIVVDVPMDRNAPASFISALP